MNKISLTIFFIVIIAIIGFLFFQEKNKNQQLIEMILKAIENRIVFFYGDGCPHCAKVEEFFKENDVESKIQFDKKEIYDDKPNAQLLFLIAQRKCNLSGDKIGVPLLWDGSKCIIGDGDIINFFKQKIQS